MKPRLAILLVLMLAGVGFFGTRLITQAAAPGGAAATAAQGGGPSIGGPFSLVNGDGKQVTDASYHGRFLLIYFGYTHCPDACPTTLGDLAAALDKLPATDRARVTPLFITVDPARDTPAIMRDYAHAFGGSFEGLTGSADQLRQVEAAYHVYAEKHPLEHGDYAMDHTSIIYVMGPDGGFLGVIGDDTKPEEIAKRLKEFGV